jgi:hypothetical protein
MTGRTIEKLNEKRILEESTEYTVLGCVVGTEDDENYVIQSAKEGYTRQ